MKVVYDADRGRLRMDEAAFHAWYDHIHEHDIGLEAVEVLAGAGLIVNLDLAPAVQAMTEPECTLTLETTTGDGGVRYGGAWICDEAAVLALQAPDDLFELITMAPMFVQAAVAKALDLSPRPASGAEPVSIRKDELLDQRTSPFNDPRGRQWEITIRLPHPLGTTRTATLWVINTPDGLWTVQCNGSGTGQIEPATSKQVWLQLLNMFPDG